MKLAVTLRHRLLPMDTLHRCPKWLPGCCGWLNDTERALALGIRGPALVKWLSRARAKRTRAAIARALRASALRKNWGSLVPQQWSIGSTN